MRLHEWAFPLKVWRAMQGLEGGEDNESGRVVEKSMANIDLHGLQLVRTVATPKVIHLKFARG